MDYPYEKMIKDLNEGKIESILFSIKGYAHYKHCIIKKYFDLVSKDNKMDRVEIQLTEDGLETVIFYKKFKDDYKLFNFGRKGSFTLKQVWNKVQILQVKYY